MSRLALARCASANVRHRLRRNVWWRLRAGVRQTSGQVAPFREAWAAANVVTAANVVAAEEGWPLWVVLGDSTAQGVGARAYDAGYVGLVRRWLAARDSVSWRVVNLSASGARVADVLADQLPLLAQQPDADLVTCVVGGNDLLRTPLVDLARSFQRLLQRLPDGAVVGTLPQGLRGGKARRVNAMLRAEAPFAGVRIADVWAHTGPPWRGRYADDLFHPNDLGYESWAQAVWDGLATETAVPAVGC